MEPDLPICQTCGVQYDSVQYDSVQYDSVQYDDRSDSVCPICADERQYVGWGGQRWTSLGQLRASGHRGVLREEAPGLYGVGTEPSFAIGQRALIVPGEGGNLLWDCITYLDDELIAGIERLGGLAAIAISHPHYYGTMIEWSRAFGDIPVYIHEADVRWVGRAGNVRFWSGDTAVVLPGRTLINAGVHFAGGTVLHWAAAAAAAAADDDAPRHAVPQHGAAGHGAAGHGAAGHGAAGHGGSERDAAERGATQRGARAAAATEEGTTERGANGRGALCSGDIFQVVMDRRYVSFMYSYPNLIPEHPDTIRRALDLVAPLDFDVIYGAWWGRVVRGDAKAALTRSADRYLRHLGLPN